jgi:hypothetical protein
MRMVIFVVLLAMAGMATARASPAPGAPSADPSTAEWYRSLVINGGSTSCCAEADCRHTLVQWREDGRPYAWIGRGADQFGDAAPDAWQWIPPQAIQDRADNPTGRPVVCFSHGTILCVVWAPSG